jgi:hypothetical protein
MESIPMKIFLQAAATLLVAFLVFQTYESMISRNVSMLCDPSEAESRACVSLGPLGAVNTASVAFCARTFVEHSTKFPRFIATQVENRGRRT